MMTSSNTPYGQQIRFLHFKRELCLLLVEVFLAVFSNHQYYSILFAPCNALVIKEFVLIRMRNKIKIKHKGKKSLLSSYSPGILFEWYILNCYLNFAASH